MKLFIAEKPSLGRLIAKSLGKQKGRQDGYIETDNGIVTWCFGHMLHQLNPEEYWPEASKWNLNTLPLIPRKWENKPTKDKKKQLKIINTLLKDKNVTEIVHCGDAGREGQLLIDEVLEFYKNKKPVKRLWLHAQDDKGVSKALNNLLPNEDYKALLDEAIGRQRADWLIGMNLTRAMTLAVGGYKELMTIGRVQTPTLGLVVKRENEINQFVPKDYYDVIAKFDFNGNTFEAKLVAKEPLPIDEDGRILDKATAAEIEKKIKQSPESFVNFFKEETKKEHPPMPHKLSTIQKVASKKNQCSTDQVLEAVQALYEGKAVSYPRTECQYLPDSLHSEASNIIPIAAAAMTLGISSLNDYIDYNRKSRAFNEAKVVEHYGIVPTSTKPNFKNSLEEAVYDSISRHYIAQFCDVAVDKHRQVILGVAGFEFKATGKVQLSPGWRHIIYNNSENNESFSIPKMSQGDEIQCLGVRIETKQTKPPSRFTEASLLDAMESIHRFVTDAGLKKKLKETAGIGTSATRSTIIKNLIGRGYLSRGKGKAKQTLFPSDLGTRLICADENKIKEIADPGFSGLFEQLLSEVGEGKRSLNDFMSRQEEILRRILSRFTNSNA